MSQISKYGSIWPNKYIIGFDRCFQIVDRCTALRHRDSYSCACEDKNFEDLSAAHGETKAENIYIAQTSAKALGRIQNMDPVHRPPLIFKRKSALLILYENLPEFRI